MHRPVLIAVAAAMAGWAAPASADCPAASLQQGDILTAIQKSATCKASFDVMDACRFNSGGDVLLANAVIKRCEATFLQRLNARQKRSYQEERAACVRKYANKVGTMYVSATVTCEAIAAVKCAQRWGAEAGRPTKVRTPQASSRRVVRDMRAMSPPILKISKPTSTDSAAMEERGIND
jgi:hypothetical protein